MVITVKTNLASLVQQHIAKILVAPLIIISVKWPLNLIRIRLNDQARIADSISVRQVIHVVPPYLGIKILDIHSVFRLDIFTASSRNR